MYKLSLQFLTPLKYFVFPIVGSGRFFPRVGVLSLVSHLLHSAGLLTHQFLPWWQMESSCSLFFPQPHQLLPQTHCLLVQYVLSGLYHQPPVAQILSYRLLSLQGKCSAVPCTHSLWNLLITWPLILTWYYLLSRCFIYWKCPGSALLNICSTSCTCTYWSQNTIFSPQKWSRDKWNMQTTRNKSTASIAGMEMPMVLRWCL